MIEFVFLCIYFIFAFPYFCVATIFCLVFYYMSPTFLRIIFLFLAVLICVTMYIYEPMMLFFGLGEVGLTCLICFLVLKFTKKPNLKIEKQSPIIIEEEQSKI